MDKRRSLINVIVSISFKVMLVIGTILVRRFLIQFLGNEINGLNSLYLSIVGFLSVAELGVGSAITFCMYKPIVEQDNVKVAALYQLFQKVYFAVGIIILSAGIAMMPFMPHLVKDYARLDINLNLTFFLMLTSVVLTYMFHAKISLINAYKDNYITTTVTSCGLILQYILQVVVLVLTHSFIWYLCCRIFTVVLQWAAVELLARIRHKTIVTFDKQKLDIETRSQVIKNVKAMFMHKIGGVLVDAVDSMTISAFVGVVILGKFSNYITLIGGMVGVISLFFSPLSSIIGHVYVSDTKHIEKHYNFFYMLNFAIGVVSFLGYYAVVDSMIVILFGDNLNMMKSVSFAITVKYFIHFMRKSTLLFRDATGTFYNDRWKALLEAVINLALSIVLVIVFSKLFGSEFGAVGVIVATIITTLAICHAVEPKVLYKYAFRSSAKGQYIKNYLCIVVFVVALFVLNGIMKSYDNPWIELAVNGGLSLIVSTVVIMVTIWLDKDFKYYLRPIVSMLFKRFKNK